MPVRTTYASVGVDAPSAERGVGALVEVLRTIHPGRASISAGPSGHYASVLRLPDGSGLAVSTDGVGTKAIVAEQMADFSTIGIDCVAMNANDVICVGAEPVALLDYLSVERVDEAMLREIATGLKRGAEDAGVEIPGGEVAQLSEMLQSHTAAGLGFDLVGTCLGLVSPQRAVVGDQVTVGDLVIGLPSAGVHANGLTLARKAFPDLHERFSRLGGLTAGEALLTPTKIYVRAVLELLRSGLAVRGLAHITSKSFRNLLRLPAEVGYRVDAPLAPLPIFDLIAERLSVPSAEMWEVFNMGCGFCCIVSPEDADAALTLLASDHPGAAVIGQATSETGRVEITGQALAGTATEPLVEIG